MAPFCLRGLGRPGDGRASGRSGRSVNHIDRGALRRSQAPSPPQVAAFPPAASGALRPRSAAAVRVCSRQVGTGPPATRGRWRDHQEGVSGMYIGIGLGTLILIIILLIIIF